MPFAQQVIGLPLLQMLIVIPGAMLIRLLVTASFNINLCSVVQVFLRVTGLHVMV